MTGCGATCRMVERAGCGNPMKILLMGDEFSAQDARRFNFVQEVTPVEQELSRAIEIADRISQQALLAVQAIRENARRSEEHTSELQSRENLVCRLLLEKKI